jgi:phosphoribosyl-ATP pyrophosphohydrolase/phosphoribosyl-AMP cyclohydrolase
VNTENLQTGTGVAAVPEGIRWNADGLLPAIVQDYETKEVVMLAYINEEALRLTLQEKRAWYYSRSRQSLWLKGETSGHFQDVVDLRFDCDQDALLLVVRQQGVACHENYFSCFHYAVNEAQGSEANESDGVNESAKAAGATETKGEKAFVAFGQPEERPVLPLGRTLELLAEVIHQRNQERPEGAYTTYLFEKGLDKILKKVGEESAETIIAAKNSDTTELRYEVSDLFYHLLVLLEEQRVGLDEISRELLSRRK